MSGAGVELFLSDRVCIPIHIPKITFRFLLGYASTQGKVGVSLSEQIVEILLHITLWHREGLQAGKKAI